MWHLGTQPTGQSLKWMLRVGGGGWGHPSSFPKGISNLQPVLRHASVVSVQNWLTGELLRGGVSSISWQRNLNLCGSPCSSSEPRRPLGVISISTRPGQHVIDGVGPYQPQVLGAEFGLGVRWRLASTSIGVPGPFFGSPPVGLVACQGRVPLPDSSEAHDGHRELGHSRTSTKQQLIYFQNKQQNEQSPKFTHRCNTT